MVIPAVFVTISLDYDMRLVYSEQQKPNECAMKIELKFHYLERNPWFMK